jgi:hypothetical protein
VKQIDGSADFVACVIRFEEERMIQEEQNKNNNE